MVQNLLCNKRDTIHYSYDMRNMLTETRNKHFSERIYYASGVPMTQSIFGYEYSINQNVRTEFPNMETMTNTFWVGPAFVNSNGTYGVIFSFALIGGLSISITGELYYEKNE